MKLVLDLETKRSFDEVGGAHNRARLGVSVVGLYNYERDVYHCYREAEFASLTELLRAAELVVGFNLHGFDWPVFASELGDWVMNLPTLDLMLVAQKELGHRVSLNSLAKATLGLSKLGSGLDALVYYRDGDWEKLERYCLEDVKLTKDLYEYALKHGHLYFEKGLQRGLIPMRFGSNPLATLFERAAKSQGSVKIVYGAKERLIDVYRFDGIYIRGYCHLRKDERTFRLDRVESAELVASSSPLFGEG
jgi:hypothetical protein